MNLTRKQKIIKYGVYCAVLLLTALLQNGFGRLLHIGNAACFALIPVSVLLGINEDERTAALLGLFGGMLWDAVSVQHMGFNCVYLMFACYFASALVSYIFRNTFLTGLLSAGAVTVLYCLLYWLLFVLPSSAEGAGGALARFYLPCAVYTLVVTPIFELLLLLLKNKVTGERQLDA